MGSLFKTIIVCSLVITVIAKCATDSSFYIFHVRGTILTFLRPENPSQYIGYRIVEDLPIVTAKPVKGYEGQPKRGEKYPPPTVSDKIFPTSGIPSGKYTKNWKTTYQDELVTFRFGENETAYFRYLDKNENLYRISVFKGVKDGIDAWMWLETDREITGSFVVQQCLRFSGAGNQEWRHHIALVPEFSEFDLWNRGEMRTLTFVRQHNSWKTIEPVFEFADQSIFKKATDFISYDIRERNRSSMNIFNTPAGVSIAEKEGVTVKNEFLIPHGLIVRESSDGKTISGMYWERTVKVTNHHPADCLHSYVDLGPVSPEERCIVRGKIYLFSGTKEDLLKHWKRDFFD